MKRSCCPTASSGAADNRPATSAGPRSAAIDALHAGREPCTTGLRLPGITAQAGAFGSRPHARRRSRLLSARCCRNGPGAVFSRGAHGRARVSQPSDRHAVFPARPYRPRCGRRRTPPAMTHTYDESRNLRTEDSGTRGSAHRNSIKPHRPARTAANRKSNADNIQTGNSPTAGPYGTGADVPHGTCRTNGRNRPRRPPRVQTPFQIGRAHV